mgnify:CR=1 FL=1
MSKKLPDCSARCFLSKEPCQSKDCRNWIDYKDEQNCSLVSIYLNGRMTLKQVSERLGVSIPRVKQIESKAIEKLNAVLRNKYASFGIYE